ncbi:butyrophilin subfamily 3 member A2-like [Eleginops maclovinus]|uniref:butyrophilin subfamily 3 member A2-like n=1 Tax=Eleginops maclovinus TaxID=56733 RepID=UPI00308048A6
MTLEWTRPDLNPRFIHVMRSGQELVDKKHKTFEGRTSLFLDELKNGNISLKLSNVQLSDKGKYRCFIPALGRETFVQLGFASGPASPPVISLSGLDGQTGGVVLQCESAGWYPEPEVLWLDAEGKLLSAGPPETVRGPDDLYTVSSRVTVEKRHSNSFTCRVQHHNTNRTTQTHLQVPDDFFKLQSSSSPVIIGLADLKREGGHKSKQRNTSEEKRRREEAEKEVQTLKEELQTKKREVESKQSELQDLLSEKQRKEKELQSLKEDLEKKSRELETIQRSINKPSSSLWFQKKAEQMKKKMKEKEKKKEKDEAEQEVETLQKHLETKQEETELNIKEFEDRRAEVQKLQEAVQGMEASLQTLMGDLESRNMESQAGGPMEPLLTPQTQTSDSGFDIEVDQHGKYIHLRNTSAQDKQLGLWELHLQVNTKQPSSSHLNNLSSSRLENLSE